ncbi:MAG: acetate/propionate family kinase [Phycisphaeraceae bacterium]|jgi:acetate kinase|nr:acetate/propionate family kinase [Phycisphaeraceae bacterium]
MLILVCNLGSTSFKYKLFDMNHDSADPRVVAEGASDRIGQGNSAWSVAVDDNSDQGVTDLADHAEAIELALDQLKQQGAVTRLDEVDAIGFKAVHGGQISDPVQVDEHVLSVMEDFCDVVPQHNPPYIAAMRAFFAQLPNTPQVAAFETGFHQSIPLARQVYGVPHEWVQKHHIRRYGFHGASHRYIAVRMAQIQPRAQRVISCHLGGSCSISAIDGGVSVANSFGMTSQTGVFHSSRVGDFDTFVLLKLMQAGMDLDTVWRVLGKESGLKGLSGISADMREVEEAADAGDQRAKLAVDAFVDSCRHYVGAYLAVLGGADAIVFTGGIGQNGKAIRAAICANMQYAGIELDAAKNENLQRNAEASIHRDGAGVQVWVVPTNEELIIAQQTLAVLSQKQTVR